MQRVGEDLGPAEGLCTYYNPNRGDELRILSGAHRLRLATYGVNGPARLCASQSG